MTKIILENMEFHAFHGCLEFEQQLGNTFIVTLSMKISDIEKAGITDKLDDTLNYQLVYDVVQEQMAIPSKLIEHVAQRIMDSILSKFPQIKEVGLRLSKLNPPLGGKVEKVTIELEDTRS